MDVEASDAVVKTGRKKPKKTAASAGGLTSKKYRPHHVIFRNDFNPHRQSIVAPHIDSFNYFLEEGLPLLVDNLEPVCGQSLGTM